MEISLRKLLLKMEEELRLAKSAESETAQRERIHSIKTLCELVLDEPVQNGAGKAGYSNAATQAAPQYAAAVQPSIPQQQMPVSQPSPMMPQPRKLEMEDNVNGDSLFDF
jgi:hypothetical protein